MNLQDYVRTCDELVAKTAEKEERQKECFKFKTPARVDLRFSSEYSSGRFQSTRLKTPESKERGMTSASPYISQSPLVPISLRDIPDLPFLTPPPHLSPQKHRRSKIVSPSKSQLTIKVKKLEDMNKILQKSSFGFQNLETRKRQFGDILDANKALKSSIFTKPISYIPKRNKPSEGFRRSIQFENPTKNNDILFNDRIKLDSPPDFISKYTAKK